jgi:hypothetical protein
MSFAILATVRGQGAATAVLCYGPFDTQGEAAAARRRLSAEGGGGVSVRVVPLYRCAAREAPEHTHTRGG